MRILIFTPFLDPYPRFCQDFPGWLASQVEEGLPVEFWSTWRMPLHLAQGRARDRALENGFSHLLFVEDDHWGFERGSLRKLLMVDWPLVGSYMAQRSRPERSSAGVKVEPGATLLVPTTAINYVEDLGQEERVREVDLVTLGFTLVTVELLRSLRFDPFESFGQVPGDSVLCEAAAQVGVRPKVHFDVRLNHGPVTHRNRDLHIRMTRLEDLPTPGQIVESRLAAQIRKTQGGMRGGYTAIERAREHLRRASSEARTGSGGGDGSGRVKAGAGVGTGAEE